MRPQAFATDHAVEQFVKRLGRTDFAECYERSVFLTTRKAMKAGVRFFKGWENASYDAESRAIFVHKKADNGWSIVTVLRRKPSKSEQRKRDAA